MIKKISKMPVVELTKGQQALYNNEIIKVVSVDTHTVRCTKLSGGIEYILKISNLQTLNLITFKEEYVEEGTDPSGVEQLKLDVENTHIYPLKESQWQKVIDDGKIGVELDVEFRVMAKTVTKGTNEFDFYEEDVVDYVELLNL